MRVKDIGLTSAREFVVGLMPPAGEVLKKHFNSTDLRTILKGEKDLVTAADLDVDEFLRNRILQKFPRAKFLTEETAHLDYSNLRNEEDLWVIDSLDGTMNFISGNPNFAISIALVSKAVTRMGVVYVPMVDKLYYAQEDLESVFLNDKPIKGISPTANLEDCNFVCDWVPDSKSRQHTFELFSKVFNRVGTIKSMGSAVSDLASFTEGRIDAYLNCGLKPWDVAATSLFVRKEGGLITTPEGKTWDIFESDIFVANSNLHPQFIRLFGSK